MTALELKKGFIKSRELHKINVIGHLSSVTVDGEDHWYHIHDDEQIPENVGLSFSVCKDYQDHWRDEVNLRGAETVQRVKTAHRQSIG